MITYKDAVYIILDELHLDNDDSSWEPSHIIYLLNKYRSFLIKQRYSNAKTDIPLSYYQNYNITFNLPNPIPLANVRCILQSTTTIPTILNLKGDTLETSAYLNNGYAPIAKELNIIPTDRFKYIGYNKYLKADIPYFTISYDNKAYLSTTIDYLNPNYSTTQTIPSVVLSAIFENPQDLLATKTITNTLNMTFPVEDALIASITELVLKELSSTIYLPQDNTNNATDDLSMNTDQYAKVKPRYTQNGGTTTTE